MFKERIRAILEKLETLRRMPDTAAWFGVENHGFRLDPPLSEPEIAAFESQHSITLPEDYRQFLLLAGNGGAGPYYGIEPLSRWDFWFELDEDTPDYLASPCPFVYEEMVSDRWREFLPANRFVWPHGSIHICDQGCSFAARLIVTGPSRGRIFNLDAHCSHPPHFVRDLNFLDWYERWLAQCLSGGPTMWFGFDNPDYGPAGRM